MKELATEPNIYQHLPELIGILIAVISPFCIVLGVLMKKLIGRMGMIKRLIKLGDSISQGINGVVFDGSCNESLSGRSYRQGLWTERWIDAIFWFEERHCKLAHENDVKYARELLRQAG